MVATTEHNERTVYVMRDGATYPAGKTQRAVLAELAKYPRGRTAGQIARCIGSRTGLVLQSLQGRNGISEPQRGLLGAELVEYETRQTLDGATRFWRLAVSS